MLSIPIEWIAYGAVAMTVCLTVFLLVTRKRLLQQLSQQQEASQALEKQVDHLSQQLALINRGTLGMGKRLMSTEKRLNQTMERQDSMENKESEQLSFKQAAKLFERGMEMDNVIEKVGITRTEAKLVDMFQQKEIAELPE